MDGELEAALGPPPRRGRCSALAAARCSLAAAAATVAALPSRLAAAEHGRSRFLAGDHRRPTEPWPWGRAGSPSPLLCSSSQPQGSGAGRRVSEDVPVHGRAGEGVPLWGTRVPVWGGGCHAPAHAAGIPRNPAGSAGPCALHVLAALDVTDYHQSNLQPYLERVLRDLAALDHLTCSPLALSFSLQSRRRDGDILFQERLREPWAAVLQRLARAHAFQRSYLNQPALRSFLGTLAQQAADAKVWHRHSRAHRSPGGWGRPGMAGDPPPPPPRSGAAGVHGWAGR